MTAFLSLPQKTRQAAFNETAIRTGITPFYLEKDFWVCRVLETLFSDPELGKFLVFRGGTSLSKAWEIINRFSEDIDLSVSRRWFGISESLDEFTGTAQKDKVLKKLREECRKKIKSVIIPVLQESAANLGTGFAVTAGELENERDPFCIYFSYPTVGTSPDNYVQPTVKIELSGRSAISPAEERSISTYLSQEFPRLFEQERREIRIPCISPERTFLEKIFLLHEAHSRPASKELPLRQSRHFYDIVKTWEYLRKNKDFPEKIKILFEEIRRHRKIFFEYKWVNYDTLTFAGLELIPKDDETLKRLEEDFSAMKNMFHGTPPPAFSEILKKIRAIQKGAA